MRPMPQLVPRLFQPRETAVKPGGLVRLRFLEGGPVALITGAQSLRTSGGLSKVQAALAAGNLAVELVDGVSGDPTVAQVQRVAERLTAISPKWIVACGGGAVLDCAKLAWALYEHPTLRLAELERPFTLPALRAKARLVAIPTTSGTGSEASIAAIVLDETAPRLRHLVSPEWLPDLVILDPSVTTSLPASTTAATAIDAFTHALESFCSPLHTVVTNHYAIMAATLIVRAAPTAVAHPTDLEAREALQTAAYLAGIAQNTTSVGAIHALSHALGASSRLPHGVGNAIVLPAVLRLNTGSSPRLAQFAGAVGLESVERLSRWVTDLAASAGLPTRWGAATTTAAQVDLAVVAEAALQDVCGRTNPRKLAKDDLRTILEATR